MNIEAFLTKECLKRKRARPFVTLSYAQSLDGSISMHRTEPLTLSGRKSLRLWHRLRAYHDAILVGIGTVLADDPRLNVRLAHGTNPQPVILDSRLRFPLRALALNNIKPPWIITTGKGNLQKQHELEARGARVKRLKADLTGRVDLHSLLRFLQAQGVKSLMVEGGARVITSFLSAQLVDCFVLTIAPTLIGGLHAPDRPPINEKTSRICDKLPRIKITGNAWYGKDLVLWGCPNWRR